jgi:exopolyphosphatase/guanosine-5'-triphosphate,3'-diphosphate pyrophosphatase
MASDPGRRPRTVGVIDIGTNTVLLLVADVTPQGSVVPQVYEQRVPRLGRDVDASRQLHPDSLERVLRVLEEYRRIMTPFAPASVAVIATSAVRDATNREEFVRAVRSRTGFDLEILPGDQEAYWTYRGAISGLSALERATVVDIGGGSTEITLGSSAEVIHSTSLDIGSVRLTERLFRHDPPTEHELRTLEEAVRLAVRTIPPHLHAGSTCVAVAGTATTLALLVQGVREFSLDAVSGVQLRRDQIASLAVGLSRMSSVDILHRGAFLEGRADVITAGAWILRVVMEHFGFERVIVSERGVRYGIALREVEAAGSGA